MGDAIRENTGEDLDPTERAFLERHGGDGQDTTGQGEGEGEPGGQDGEGEAFEAPQLREPEPKRAPAKRRRGKQQREQDEDEAMEAIGHALDLEAERHKDAVAEILGPDMGDLVPCPLCVTPGFVLVSPPPDFDPMQRAAVMMAMGEDAPEVLKRHPDLYRCAKCDGWGDLDSGSRRDVTKRQQCPDCMGKGFRSHAEDKALETAQAPQPGLTAVPPLPQAPPMQPTPDSGLITQGGHTFRVVPGGSPDPSGRLAGHPLWGYDVSLGGV